MADVEANLRAKVTVDGAKQGTVELNNLANAGDRAGKKLDLMDKFVGSANKALNYLAVGMEKLNLSYEKGDISLDSYNKKLDKLSNSMSRLQKIARGTSDTFNQFGKTQQTYAQIAGSNTREAAQANRFNTGNIAAQFQDIAVTSAMNMNPLTIGLQQGTQLAYVLGQSKAPLADFAAGIKNLVSPVTLLSVGLTALVAVIIQAVDWVNVGKTALNGLASAFDWVAENSEVVAAGLGVVTLEIGSHILKVVEWKKAWENTVGFITGIKWKSIGSSILNFAKMLINPWVLIPALVLAAIEAFAMFPDGIKKALNVAIDFVTTWVNKTIGLFNAVIDVARHVPVAIKDAFSGKEFSDIMSDFNNIMAEDLTKQYVKSDKIKTVVDGAVNTVSKGVEKVNSVVSNSVKSLSESASSGLRSMADGLGKNDKEGKKLQKTIDDLTNSYKDLIASGWEKVEDMKFEQSIQGMSEYDQTIEKTTRDLEKQVEAIRQRALAEGVELPILKNYKSEIEEIARATADTKLQMDLQTESLKLQDEVINFYSSTTKSFFSDMKSGLQEGQSAWEAFGNAVMNILDKIADKMMDMAVNAIFNGLQTDSAGNKNQGFLGSLISGTMKGVMSAQMPSMNVTGVGNVSGGNVAVTNASYTGPFAKGGAFSNGVYNSPTMFAFANGGKFGVMGEAGPEAVMPLTRRSDGSLGVRADGVGGGSPVVVNVINNSNAQARTQERQTEQGTTIDVMIDEMVAQKLGQTGTASNQALTAFNNRQLIAR